MAASPKPRPENEELGDDEIKKIADIFAARLLARMETKEREKAAWEAKTGGPRGPSNLPPDLERAKLIHNERVKASATLLNGLSAAFILGSGLTTFSNLAEFSSAWPKILGALLWLAFGAIFHLLARTFLGSLR